MAALYGIGVEYALHTMLNLALAAPSRPPSARELATFQRLPQAYTRQLLLRLQRGGLLLSGEGRAGGWRLARPPEAITVADIVDAVHGTASVFDCAEVRANCVLWPPGEAPAVATSGQCAIDAVMQRAAAAMRAELAACTLADLAAQVRAKRRAAGLAEATVWFAHAAGGRRRSPAGEGGNS